MLKVTGKGEVKKIGGSLFVRLPPELLTLLEVADYNVEVDLDKGRITIMLQKPLEGDKNGF